MECKEHPGKFYIHRLYVDRHQFVCSVWIDPETDQVTDAFAYKDANKESEFFHANGSDEVLKGKPLEDAKKFFEMLCVLEGDNEVGARQQHGSV